MVNFTHSPRGNDDCYFRAANGRSRRKAPVADRGLGRLKWAESGLTGVAQGTAGIGRKPDIRRYAASPHLRSKQASTEARQALRMGPTSNATLRVPKFDYVISNTAILAAMPRSECSLGDGVMPLVSSSRAHPPWPTTRPVAKIEVDVARPCTREAMLTV
jgi:hypothetical protein